MTATESVTESAARAAVELPAGTTDVVLALPDLQGRLQGIRLSAPYFTEHVAAHGYGACRYLLAADVEMETGAGYAIDPTGFGDFLLRPDLSTLRPVPWQDGWISGANPADAPAGTALVIADAYERDGTAVSVAPRQVLRAQLDRLAAYGLRACVGTELEFLVFTDGYQRAYRRDYAGLRPATRFNSDYALVGLGGLDGVVRDIVRGMTGAGLAVESARAEVHPGQYEIVFRYTDALAACDGHVLYKTGAKQIADAAGLSLTFMAKYDAGEGNSCHIHLSLRDEHGAPVFAAPGTGGMSPLMEHFVAGQLAVLREFTPLFAPTINSYKRLQPGAFAPTEVDWGHDDRTRPVRVIGSGDSLRIEHRVGGGDANPYLAVAGVIAAGLYGIERELPLPSPAGVAEDAGTTSTPRPALPRDLASATELWTASEAARGAFGEAFVDHYARAAHAELAAFATAVTDWERRRAFERL